MISPRVQQLCVRVVALAAALAAGCTAVKTSPPPGGGLPTVALAVIVRGGGAPTPQQFANIHRALEPHLKNAGYSYARSAETADFILKIAFTPDAIDIQGGHVKLAGMERNRRIQRTPSASEQARNELGGASSRAAVGF